LEQASATARSLDYAYDDFCISQVAEALGKHEDAAMFRERALNYEKSYDTTTGFMRGRNEDGSWLEPFNPTTWGNPYVEGGAWQSTWSVPHDPSGLISLMGGPEPFTAKLDEFLTCAPRFEVGTYGFEIHEMTEMACADFGQYAHSNQPVHHVLFLYASAGKPWRTQYWVRRVMEELYSPEDLPGDEDNGEMSAWYVLNALGIFPLCPGHPSYVFSTPLFDKVRLKRDGRDDLVITSSGNGPDRFYVGGISVDGTPTQALSISHSDFLSAREIAFTMSDTPVERVVADEDLPFSMSRGRYGGLALGAWR
jgi:predicted alpha-1,2-mannosidase